MNFGLRAEQINARRFDVRSMNIRERTALWYRLERIGSDYPPEKDEGQVSNLPIPEPQWDNRQWDTINQLRGQVNFLQGKIHEHLDKKPKQKGQPIKAIEYE